MVTVKYCPNCGFEEENFEFDGCPECGKPLMVRQTDDDKIQTVGSDNSRQQASKVDLGMGAAVNGNVTSNTTTVDNSTSNVINNVTNVIKEKSETEKHAENVKVYSRRCRALCIDGLISKEGEKELDILRGELGIAPDEAQAILAQAKRCSKKLRTELTPEGHMRINKTFNIINGNHKDALVSELNALCQWKQEYNVDELDQIYYQLFAILTPKQFVVELEESVEENYWQNYWAVVAYQLLGLPTKSEACMAHLNAWDRVSLVQNKLVLSAVVALMQCDEASAHEAFNAVNAGYSEGLKSVFNALKDLLVMDWDRELATLPASHQFYYDTLFKDYTSRCMRFAAERRKEREAEEERRRHKQQEADELERQHQREVEAVRAESERVANEVRLAEEQKAAQQAKAKAEAEERRRQEAERERLDAERKKAEAERAKERAEWWHRNLRWFVVAAFVVVIVVASLLLYRSCEDKRQQQEAYQDSIRQDFNVSVERRQQFDDLSVEFEKKLNQPLTLNNAYQNIVDSRKILQQMLQLLSKTTTPYEELPQNLINQYNSHVNAAIKTYNDAIDDPNSAPQREDLKRELNPLKESVRRLYYNN